MKIPEFLYDEDQKHAAKELLRLLESTEQSSNTQNVLHLLRNNRTGILQDSNFIAQVRSLSMPATGELKTLCDSILYWHCRRKNAIPSKHEVALLLENIVTYLPNTTLYLYYQQLREIHANYDLYIMRDWLYSALTETYQGLHANTTGNISYHSGFMTNIFRCKQNSASASASTNKYEGIKQTTNM